jgi:hypothetical protein
MPNRIVERGRKLPRWLRVLGGLIVAVMACGLVTYGGFIVFSMLAWAAISRPVPCIDREAGSPAIFSNGGTQLFVFPESTSNIESSCLTWQGASIDVWFEIDPSDLETFLDSMRWDVRPLTQSTEPPYFGHPKKDATYLYGEFSEYPEGAKVWIDLSGTRYRIFIYAWLD